MPVAHPVANKDVPQATYNAGMAAWLSESQLELRVKLGATLAKDIRQVTPPMIRATHTFLLYMYSHGCTSAVLSAVKLRDALTLALKQSPQLLGTWPHGDCVAATLAHLQAISTMCRAYAREEIEASTGRRFPRSGGIGRKLDKDGMDMMDDIVKLLKIPSDEDCTPAASDADGDNTNSLPRMELCDDLVAASTRGAIDDDDDDDAWPA